MNLSGEALSQRCIMEVHTCTTNASSQFAIFTLSMLVCNDQCTSRIYMYMYVPSSAGTVYSLNVRYTASATIDQENLESTGIYSRE